MPVRVCIHMRVVCKDGSFLAIKHVDWDVLMPLGTDLWFSFPDGDVDPVAVKGYHWEEDNGGITCGTTQQVWDDATARSREWCEENGWLTATDPEA